MPGEESSYKEGQQSWRQRKRVGWTVGGASGLSGRPHHRHVHPPNHAVPRRVLRPLGPLALPSHTTTPAHARRPPLLPRPASSSPRRRLQPRARSTHPPRTPIDPSRQQSSRLCARRDSGDTVAGASFDNQFQQLLCPTHAHSLVRAFVAGLYPFAALAAFLLRSVACISQDGDSLPMCATSRGKNSGLVQR